MPKRPRVIAISVRRHVRLIVNSKSYHVEVHDFNPFVKGMAWRSVQRAPLAIGDDTAVLMLHRRIIAEQAAHDRVYSDMAEKVRKQFEKQMLHGLSYGLGKPLPTSGHDDALRASYMYKYYYRGAQRGRDRLPQPVTAGSNRGAKA